MIYAKIIKAEVEATVMRKILTLVIMTAMTMKTVYMIVVVVVPIVADEKAWIRQIM